MEKQGVSWERILKELGFEDTYIAGAGNGFYFSYSNTTIGLYIVLDMCPNTDKVDATVLVNSSGETPNSSIIYGRFFCRLYLKGKLSEFQDFLNRMVDSLSNHFFGECVSESFGCLTSMIEGHVLSKSAMVKKWTPILIEAGFRPVSEDTFNWHGLIDAFFLRTYIGFDFYNVRKELVRTLSLDYKDVAVNHRLPSEIESFMILNYFIFPPE